MRPLFLSSYKDSVTGLRTPVTNVECLNNDAAASSRSGIARCVALAADLVVASGAEDGTARARWPKGPTAFKYPICRSGKHGI
jgi:hypothetical protein